MLYAIISQDVENSLPLRKKARAQHLSRLEILNNQGRLTLAGPHPSSDSSEQEDKGFSGSLIVAQFDSLSEAQKWANADPYIEAGVYQSVIVKPFKKVLP